MNAFKLNVQESFKDAPHFFSRHVTGKVTFNGIDVGVPPETVTNENFSSAAFLRSSLYVTPKC